MNSYIEPLLIDQSHTGLCGVDLPALPAGFTPRTGAPLRGDIGLPQVSEPMVVRHFTRLSQMNYAIDTHMYPLGSCTMKHNPRINEKLARLAGFSALHPLQPTATTQGALALMHTLGTWLVRLTNMADVSLVPSAGAHGEFTGVMMIRAAHEARGRARTTILVPDSAHGTNPATAAMCGYTCKSVKSTAEGLVDLDDLAAHLNDDVAAFMITNPNTCGLFEENIDTISRMVHDVGAFMYCDGANFNAIVGKVCPGDLGIDVMQFNLHKTFSTPHGGGGPGSGPVVVSDALAPYLPVPRVVKEGDTYRLDETTATSIGRIRAYHGQFGMMVRALAFMLSHGVDGLKQVAEDAVLNANYIMQALKDTYHTPYAGPCMHECLISDKRQKAHDVTTMDIAKNLIDAGFHPMTVYFPLVVNGAMLIEPTESESKETLDAFIAAMKEIAQRAENGDTESLHAAPTTTPRRRVDEVAAARNPILSAHGKGCC